MSRGEITYRMKGIATRGAGCLLAAAVLPLGAGPAGAASLPTYTFENYQVGDPLTLHDGWAQATPIAGTITVGTGTGSDASKVINSSANNTYYKNVLATPVSFTSANMSVDIYLAPVSSGQQKYSFIAPLESSSGFPTANTALWFGLENDGDAKGYYTVLSTNANTWTNIGTGDKGLTGGDWYRLTLTMNYSLSGSTGTLSYQDLTAQGPVITDGTLHNVTLTGLTSSYWGTGVLMGGFSIDNINVPEPSTCVLAAAGGLMLVWRRKRNF